MLAEGPDRHVATARSLFEAGQAAWPGLELPFEAFAGLVEERSISVDAEPALAHAADLYLACACSRGVPGAIEAFDRSHLRQVRQHLAFLAPSEAFVDEVRQVIREKLFVRASRGNLRIDAYNGRSALSSWVKVIAKRAAIDLQRRGDGPRPRPTGPEVSEVPLDPEVAHLKLQHRAALNDAFRRAIAALPAEQLSLLRRHYLDAQSLEVLAEQAGVHRATVARWIAAARQGIIDGARQLLQGHLGASDSEVESLIRVMRSQIDVTLNGSYSSASWLGQEPER